MRTSIRNSALLATAVVMALALSGDGLADEKQREAHKKPHGGQFTVAGKHTGMLYGTIQVGGRQVQVTKDTKVYLNGEGFVSSPMLYGDAIYVMGTRTKSGFVARMIIVRPLQANDSSADGDRTRKLPPDTQL